MFVAGGRSSSGELAKVEAIDVSGKGMACAPIPDLPVKPYYPVAATGKPKYIWVELIAIYQETVLATSG